MLSLITINYKYQLLLYIQSAFDVVFSVSLSPDTPVIPTLRNVIPFLFWWLLFINCDVVK